MILRLKVTVEVLAAGAGLVAEDYVRVVVTNVGWWSITLTSIALEFLGSKAMADLARPPQSPPNSPMPIKLARGQTAHRSYAFQDISDRLTQRIGAWTTSGLYGCCTDVAGRVYRSEVWRFTPGHS
jgi:hypothetical protein